MESLFLNRLILEKLFLTVLRTGMTASFLILAVIAARLLLKKAPKSMICILWGVVGLRLLCPFSIQTSFGLLPQSALTIKAFASFTAWRQTAQDGAVAGLDQILSQDPDFMQDPDLNLNQDSGQIPGSGQIQHSGQIPGSGQLSVQNSDLNSDQNQAQAASPSTDVTKVAGGFPAMEVWAAGCVAMAAYFIYSWRRVQKLVAQAVPATTENIRFYQCDRICTPFLFGLAHPKIYVPFSVCGQELSYILKHEQAHKRRLDHITKFIGYLLLTIYWPHPLVWAAYLLFCRDIELACDERVVKKASDEFKCAYSQALLSYSLKQNAAALPVAFAEIGVKKRVKHILTYQKPGRRWMTAAAALCMILTLCFATEAKSRRAPNAKTNTDTSASQKIKQADAPKSDQTLGPIKKSVTKWANAFCARDAKTIYRMLDETGRKNQDMLDGKHSFGWSSPWPWETDVIDEAKNYRILSLDQTSAKILYYAWTSDPHVTVWLQDLSYKYSAKKDQLVIHDAPLKILDSIDTTAQFYAAYPNGEINGTRMDYFHGNGVGKALNENTLRDDGAKILLDPKTAASSLLNIQNDPSVVKVKKTVQNGETIVTFTFLKDGGRASVKMIQPYGKQGIWVPQTASKSGSFVPTLRLTPELYTQAQAKEKNVYWLTGVSKPADGQLEMYFQKDSLLLKGKAKKSASEKNLYNAKSKKINETLKIADNCKISFVEAEETATSSYKDWLKVSCEYKEGDPMSFICVVLKVKNHKIVKIIFSA